MCGIFLCVFDQSNTAVCKEILKNETIHYFLSRRGPDHFEKITLSHQFDAADQSSLTNITMLSSVLQLRGCFVCNQPIVHEESGSVLQWNGQIFAGFSGKLNPEQSDTEQLLEALDSSESVESFLEVVSSIQGPWAFTFWDNRTKRLWIGRDILGRRSLCWNTNYRDQILLVSSVAHVYTPPEVNSNSKPLTCKLNPANFVFEEIPTYGVYCFEFGSHSNLSDVITNVRHFSWNRSICGQVQSNLVGSLQLNSPITVSLNTSLPDEETAQSLTNVKDIDNSIPSDVIDEFYSKLSHSVEVRCGNHHNVCRKCFARYVKHNERTNGSDRSYSSDSEDEMRVGLSNTINGIKFRECTHASTAILFSGGLDSTVLALLADKFVPTHLPIDLLNVAFNNDAPDRETGLRAWQELRVLRPNRKWNFVSIHISKEELEASRAKHIRFLVKPSQTVLDDSIGCAVWFATQGKGLLMQTLGEITSFTCQTRARVVLLGMGADEQLAGYSRHRKAFLYHSWSGLLAELTTDVERISSRNLGRDDRVTADHGIEARFPFLDESVINYLNSLPVWHKCNLNLERSKGEKLLLRLLAHRLGLRATSQHLKRAIQFGSRISKLEDRTEKGDNLCSRLAC